MNILFVVSGNCKPMPFVEEQKISLEKKGLNVDYFFIYGKGIVGYLRNLPKLKKIVELGKYDVIHAHYSLAGLLSCLQRHTPTIITFHGSDINIGSNRLLSGFASRLSAHNIFVNANMARMLYCKRKYSVIPCGVDLETFHFIGKNEAKKQLLLDTNKKYILFTSSFSNPVKNYPLAKAALSLINENIELLELKGRSRQEVNLLLNACDLLLMTSFSEGSPQIIKEALACNTPIVSTKVGDVAEQTNNVSSCYLANFDSSDLASKIHLALTNNNESNSRFAVTHLSLESIADKVIGVYKKAAS